MKPKRRRLWYLSLIALFVSGATLIFLMPTDVLKKKPTTAFRLGGLVEEGTLQRQDNLWISFQVTDGATTIPLRYQGILPDLFREGQGVVADGTLSKEGVFIATRLLAKHDETYMPKDVADALKTTWRWKPPEKKEKTS
jgi:cytochrome c-type biogenesis protein CcmE